MTVASVDQSPFAPPKAAYIHVPFCAHRCGYCDFTLIAGRDDLIGDYVHALNQEIDRAQFPGKPKLNSLFWGGGTPTHPPLNDLARMLKSVHDRFEFDPSAEISIEANPLDLTDQKIDLLAASGINRISLGVQSFSLETLKLLERDHRPEQVVDVVSRLRKHFDNISFDLIFGVVGQSIESWKQTLQQAIELNPTHISTYGLTFEKGTAFWNRREKGELIPVDEELEREQYAIAMELLSEAGFDQYEISNHARPGFECQHNHTYWNGDAYWAFGPGAARYIEGRRETNIRSVLSWLLRIERDQSPVADSEELGAESRARELIYLGLRRNRGIDRKTFFARTGFRLEELCGPALQRQKELGLLEGDGNTIRLSDEGRFVADRVVMEFL